MLRKLVTYNKLCEEVFGEQQFFESEINLKDYKTSAFVIIIVVNS